MVTHMDGLIVEYRAIENATLQIRENAGAVYGLYMQVWYEAVCEFERVMMRAALNDLDDPSYGGRVSDILRAAWGWSHRAGMLEYGSPEWSRDWLRDFVLANMSRLIETLRRARWLSDYEARRYTSLLRILTR